MFKLRNLVLILLAISCADNVDNGIITINEEGFSIQRFPSGSDALQIQVDDVVSLFLFSELETDSSNVVLKNSFTNQDTTHFHISSFRSKGSFSDALLHLHNGDSALIELLTTNITHANDSLSRKIFMKVKILDVAPKSVFEARLNSQKEKILKNQDKQILTILNSHSRKNFAKIDNGLYLDYIKNDTSNKFQTVFGDLVKVHLVALSLEDSSVFENTYSKEQTLDFLVGFNTVYQSLEKAAKLLSASDSVHLYFASQYGKPAEFGKINDGGPFVFKINVTDIIDGSKKN